MTKSKLQIPNEKKETEEVAIKVENLSKVFKVPHEKQTTIKGAAVNLLKKKSYEKFEALKDISFEVKKGEFFGIIGRNGSGKSTLLKILAGIYVPDGGRVTINGKLSPFLELGVGFNPELTGRENLFLGGAILGLTRKEVAEKFDSIVRFAELKEFIDMKLKNYSSGMQVRLAFSLAINAHAEILLMDEVLAVGDTNFQAKCLHEFNSYREKGKTVILVTHDIATVQGYCDRAMLIRAGKIAKIGPADIIGDEYINQNISDEEERIDSEREDSETDEKSSLNEDIKKVAEIKSVDLIGSDGKSKNGFETGESIDIVIDFKVNKEKRPLNLGVGLHSFQGGQVLGYNTKIDDFRVNNEKNQITLHFEAMPLLAGEYFLNIICFGEEGSVSYDFKPKYKIFRIYSKGLIKNYGGLVNIDHEWKQ